MRSPFVAVAVAKNVAKNPLAQRLVIAVVLALASAGCTEKACLRWSTIDRDAGAPTGGAGGAGGTGGAGGGSAGGAGGAAGAADAGAMTGTGGGVDAGTDAPPEVKCPPPTEALKILGQPSCTESIQKESIQSLNSDGGVYDPETDQCCYEVTTETKPCGS